MDEVRRIHMDVDRFVAVAVQLELASQCDMVEVITSMAEVDSSPTLGNVVLSSEAADLALNGRTLTQLGPLQPGVYHATTLRALVKLLASWIEASGAHAMSGDPIVQAKSE